MVLLLVFHYTLYDIDDIINIHLICTNAVKYEIKYYFTIEIQIGNNEDLLNILNGAICQKQEQMI